MADGIVYRQYMGESDLPHIMALVQSELSEPYVVYTFRYFLNEWPHLAYLAFPNSAATIPIGAIVCKQSAHKSIANRGYIAMLSVDKRWRKRGIASSLVRRSVETMKQGGVTEIMLETEYDNYAALSLYESLGFIREKRLYRFYLNGKDAFRLIRVIPPPSSLYSDSDNTDSSGSEAGSPPTSSSMLLYQQRRMASGAPPYRAIPVIPYSDDEDDEVSRR